MGNFMQPQIHTTTDITQIIIKFDSHYLQTQWENLEVHRGPCGPCLYESFCLCNSHLCATLPFRNFVENCDFRKILYSEFKNITNHPQISRKKGNSIISNTNWIRLMVKELWRVRLPVYFRKIYMMPLWNLPVVPMLR